MKRRRLIVSVFAIGLIGGAAMWWRTADRLSAEEMPFVGTWQAVQAQSKGNNSVSLRADRTFVSTDHARGGAAVHGRWAVRDSVMELDYDGNLFRRAARPLLKAFGVNFAGMTPSAKVSMISADSFSVVGLSGPDIVYTRVPAE